MVKTKVDMYIRVLALTQAWLKETEMYPNHKELSSEVNCFAVNARQVLQFKSHAKWLQFFK